MFSAARVLFFAILLCYVRMHRVLCDDYCNVCLQNSFDMHAQGCESRPHNSSIDYHLPVPVPVSSNEFGVRRYSKSLHCCASNYKSIYWFKDNKPYPWSEEVSDFVIDSQSRNQSIVVKSLSKEDAGVYSCLIENDSYKVIRRSITLKVFGTSYTGVPINTFIAPPIVHASIGEKVVLYCEAFVGNIKLPDAQNKIDWFKVEANGTRTLLLEDLRYYVKKVIKDDGLILGLYLFWKNLQPEDYGVYVCSVSNAADQITDMYSEIKKSEHFTKLSLAHVWPIMLYAICASFVFIVLVYFLYCRYSNRIRLCFRQFTASDEEIDKNKDIDVFILYEMKEINFVTGYLIPTLVNTYDYVVSSHVLQNNVDDVNMEFQAHIADSKTVLLVVSCPSHDKPEEIRNFSQNLRVASNLCSKVICLLVQMKSDNKLNHTEMRKHSSRLRFIEWPAFKKDWSKLWHLLRLQLPMKKSTFNTNSLKRYSTVNDKRITYVL